MNADKGLSALFGIILLSACMGTPPKMPESNLAGQNGGIAPDSALLVNKNKCTGTNMVLASVEGAHFSWTANKGLSTDSKLDIPVIGTTDLAGCIFPKSVAGGQTLEGGSAKIDFRPETTNSFSTLRDHRIIQYIFGYDLPDDPEGSPSNNESTAILQFTAQSIARVGGTSLALPTTVGDAIALKVNGTLQIAGLKVPVEVPVALTKTDKGFNATNSDAWTLNVRGGNPATNTLGLDARVTEILALVVNGTLQDLIDVKFSIDFVDLCAQ